MRALLAPKRSRSLFMDARELDAALARPQSLSLTNRSAALLRLDETWTGTDNRTYNWTPELAPMA